MFDTLLKLIKSYQGQNKINDLKVYVSAALALGRSMNDRGVQLEGLPKFINQLEQLAREQQF